MPTAERAGDLIRIEAGWHEKDRVREVPGARYSSTDRAWTVPLSWGSCQALRGVFGTDLTVGPELTRWAVDQWAWIREVQRLKENPVTPPDGQVADGLWPHQEVGARFLVLAGSAVLGDVPGIGKTIVGIETLRRLGPEEALPALVVCPNSMKSVWLEELRKWAPELRPVALVGTKTKRLRELAKVEAGEADVAVVNWEALRTMSRLAPYGSVRLSEREREEQELNRIAWRTVVADEAHHAQDPKAKQTRALWYLGQGAAHRFGLSGTPLTRAPDTLWGLLHFVSPADWPVKSPYVSRYCLQTFNSWGGMDVVGLRADTRDEFFRILDPRFLRRTKEMVHDLPRRFQVRTVPMDPKQRRAYDALEKEMLAELDAGTWLVATNPLSRSTRLMQLASSYLKVEVDAEGREEVRLAAPSCKVDALLDVARERAGEPTVVFAESNQLLRLCEDRLGHEGIGFVSIRGGVSEADRALARERFERGEVPLLLMNSAGGEGLTLTAADTMVLLQEPWSNVLYRQVLGRIDRMNQTAPELMYIFIRAEGTIEGRKEEVLGEKATMLEEVCRDTETMRRLLGG